MLDLNDEQYSSKLRPSRDVLEKFENELNKVVGDVRADLGQQDVDYIRGVIRKKTFFEYLGRGLIHFGIINPISWVIGVFFLSIAKIVENMEIGHNIMHGQYDWTKDPELRSVKYEWDNVCDADSWRATHNFEHHTFTNIIGKDRDFGYELLRLSAHSKWSPSNIFQFFYFMALMVLFQWGVAVHELKVGKLFVSAKHWGKNKDLLKAFSSKAGKQLFKDYVFFPLIAGPIALQVVAGNLIANFVRNLWSAMIIFCGHFTENVHVFKASECEDESKGQWYYRQILGSSNITGRNWFHLLTGHLSFQVEHHLFPDIPARRYPSIAPQVQAICEKYDIPYNTGSFSSQFGGVLKRILKYSLPQNKEMAIVKLEASSL